MTEYSHQDLHIKQKLFSIKVRDKSRHKRRHKIVDDVTEHRLHALPHTEAGGAENTKSKHFNKSELFWHQNVLHVLTKKMPTHT